VEIADLAGCDITVAGELYFRLSERIELVSLLNAVSALGKQTRWDALARLSLRDELYDSTRALTLDVLAHAMPGENTAQMIAEWERRNESRLLRARNTLTEIAASQRRDLAALSVASRQLRRLAG
jgi:glutamate dehydrogenase